MSSTLFRVQYILGLSSRWGLLDFYEPVVTIRSLLEKLQPIVSANLDKIRLRNVCNQEFDLGPSEEWDRDVQELGIENLGFVIVYVVPKHPGPSGYVSTTSQFYDLTTANAVHPLGTTNVSVPYAPTYMNPNIAITPQPYGLTTTNAVYPFDTTSVRVSGFPTNMSALGLGHASEGNVMTVPVSRGGSVAVLEMAEDDSSLYDDL
jgi:hypothetical protein